jgi:hypothetical protein
MGLFMGLNLDKDSVFYATDARIFFDWVIHFVADCVGG